MPKKRGRETAAGHPLESDSSPIELEELMMQREVQPPSTPKDDDANALSDFADNLQFNTSNTQGNEALGSAQNLRRGTVRAVLSMPVRSLRMSMSSVNHSSIVAEALSGDAHQHSTSLMFKDTTAETAFGAFTHGDKTSAFVIFGLTNLFLTPFTILASLTEAEVLSLTIRLIQYTTLAISLAAMAMLFHAYRREAADRERAMEMIRTLSVAEHSPLDEDCDPQSFETDGRSVMKMEIVSGVALAVIYLIFYAFAAGKAPENCSDDVDRFVCSRYIQLDGGVAAAFVLPLAILPLRFAACVLVTVVCTSLFILVREIPPLQHSTPEYRIVSSMFYAILACISLWTKRLNEIESRAHFQELCHLERQREKSKRLAEYFSSIAASMIPEHVAMRIARGEVYRERVDNGIVCCVGVRHFGTIATEWSSNDVVLMLQEATVQMDAVVKQHEPFAAKLHSFGDEYIVTIRPGTWRQEQQAAQSGATAVRTSPATRRTSLEKKTFESRSDSSATDDSSRGCSATVASGRSIDTALSFISGIARVSRKLCAQRGEPYSDTVCLDVAVDIGSFFATTFGSQKNFLAVGPCVERCRVTQRGIEAVQSIALCERSLGHEVPVVCVADALLPTLGSKYRLQMSYEPTLWPQLVDLEHGHAIPHPTCHPQTENPHPEGIFGSSGEGGRCGSLETDVLDDGLAVFLYPSRLITAPLYGGATPLVLEGSSTNTPIDSVNSVPRAAQAQPRQHRQPRSGSPDQMEGNQFLDAMRIVEPSPSSALPSALSNPLDVKCRNSHFSRVSTLGPPLPAHSPITPSPADRSPNTLQSRVSDDLLLMHEDASGTAPMTEDVPGPNTEKSGGLVRVPFLPLYRFARSDLEDTYRAAEVQDSGPRIVGELCAFLAIFMGCLATLVIEDNTSFAASSPLLWACIGCVISTCGALAEGIPRARHTKQLPRWSILPIEAMLAATYVAIIVLAKETTSLLSKGHILWLSVILLLSMARERGATVPQTWLVDFVLSVPFLWLSWLQHNEGVRSAMMVLSCLFVVLACVCRGLIDRARRTRFLTSEESRLVQAQLVRDSEGLEALLESMVPNETFAQLFRRARIASAPVIHAMRGLRGALPRGTLFSTKVDVMSILHLSFSPAMGEPPGSRPWWTACDAGLSLVHQGLKLVREACVIKTSGDTVMVVDDSSQDPTEQAVTLLQLVSHVVCSGRAHHHPHPSTGGSTTTTVRAVLSSGPVSGAVLGIAALSFEYYGEPVAVGALLLRELPAGCEVLATTRFVELLQWWSLFASPGPRDVTAAAAMDCVHSGFIVSSAHAPPHSLGTSTQTSHSSVPASSCEERLRGRVLSEVPIYVHPVQLWKLRGVRAKVPVHVMQFGGSNRSNA